MHAFISVFFFLKSNVYANHSIILVFHLLPHLHLPKAGFPYFAIVMVETWPHCRQNDCGQPFYAHTTFKMTEMNVDKNGA